MKVKAHAIVRVTVELVATSWGENCNLAQVYKQAKSDAIDRLSKLRVDGITVTSAPEITAVLVEDKT